MRHPILIGCLLAAIIALAVCSWLIYRREHSRWRWTFAVPAMAALILGRILAEFLLK